MPNDSSLSSIKEEDNFTRSALEANPLTAALAVPFADFITVTWQSTHLLELQLDYDVALAGARVLQADAVLNTLVKKLDTTLLLLTNKDRSAPLYVQFFGNRRPFEVAAGVLGPQLETMRAWIPLLTASPHDSLQSVGAEIAAAVDQADAAVGAKTAADNATLVFQTTGERAKLIHAYNALRKGTYGMLGKMKHQNPELPNDFADSFFRHETRRTEDRMTPEQLQIKLDALASQQSLLQKKLDAALARQQADADAKAELEQKKALLEAKKKEKDALDASIKKLEAELRT